MTELKVAVIFPKIVDAVFSEDSLDKVEAVAQGNQRNVFLHDQTHGSLELGWELLVEVTSSSQE